MSSAKTLGGHVHVYITRRSQPIFWGGGGGGGGGGGNPPEIYSVHVGMNPRRACKSYSSLLTTFPCVCLSVTTLVKALLHLLHQVAKGWVMGFAPSGKRMGNGICTKWQKDGL